MFQELFFDFSKIGKREGGNKWKPLEVFWFWYHDSVSICTHIYLGKQHIISVLPMQSVPIPTKSLTLWVEIPLMVSCTPYNIIDEVFQWLACLWFSPDSPVSSTNKTVCHNITETLLKVALNTITLTHYHCRKYFVEQFTLFFTRFKFVMLIVWLVNWYFLFLSAF
jgi:hypothetical protein